jgi:general secretion pathway protein F
MPAFAYDAVDPAGRRLRGREDAATPAALMRSLEERGWLVLDVGESDAAGAVPSLGFGRARAVLDVTRALAALLPAGMPLARALGAASHVAGGPVAGAISSVRERVEAGQSLATALAEHPAVFPPLYIGIVRAGERSGDVSAAFARLADQLEREDRLRSRILSLSIYPLILGALGGVAVLVLLFVVLPRFVELLAGAGATLPRSTALLLAASAFVRSAWPVLLMIPVAAFLFATWARSTDEGRRAAALLWLRLPLVRHLRQQALTARFARLASTLLSSGAPLLTALDDTVDCLDDPIAREEVVRIRTRVREGVALNRAVSEGTLFPPLLAQLVAVGEEAGRIGDFLGKAAEMFEERTERDTQRLVSLLEPAMIVFFGTMVAFVALSLLQAIYGVNASSFK